MSAKFWIKRFFVVLLGAFVLLVAAQLLKSHDLNYALIHGAIWAPITAGVFSLANYFRARRCAICKDTPETQDGLFK